MEVGQVMLHHLSSVHSADSQLTEPGSAAIVELSLCRISCYNIIRCFIRQEQAPTARSEER